MLITNGWTTVEVILLVSDFDFKMGELLQQFVKIALDCEFTGEVRNRMKGVTLKFIDNFS